jgi:PAS domain S-box-containing protein
MQPESFAAGTLFSRIFHASPVAMTITTSGDGRLIDVNAAYAKLIGCQREEIVGQLPDRTTVSPPLASASQNPPLLFDQPRTGQFVRFLATDNTPRDVIVTSQVVDWDGEAFLFSLLQDLTDYFQTRHELDRSEARFQQFFESVPLPVFVFDCETTDIIDANTAAVNQYGFSRDELLSMTMLDIRPPEERYIFLHYINTLPDDVQSVGTLKHRWKDGAIRDVYVTSYGLTLAGRAIRLAVIQDVTEQMALQKALKGSEERLRIIAEVSTDAIWEVDPRTQEVYFTHGINKLFGHDPDDYIDLDWWKMHIHPDERDGIFEGFKRSIDGDDVYWAAQYRFCRADGNYAHVLDRGYILRDEAGQPIKIIGTMVDITPQIEIKEAAALAAMEERRRLARDLHDAVTQSLYSLSLMAEAARRRAQTGDGQETHDYIVRLGELAQQSLKEMRLLVYEMRPSALEENGLAEALQARLDAVERRAGVEARLTGDVTRELSPEVQVQLYRIAEEALNNTLKHAAASAVAITIHSGPDGINLRISDNGRGFDALKETTSGGLGLVSMRERAAKLGGVLEIETASGRGTTVTLTLDAGEKT